MGRIPGHEFKLLDEREGSGSVECWGLEDYGEAPHPDPNNHPILSLPLQAAVQGILW